MHPENSIYITKTANFLSNKIYIQLKKTILFIKLYILTHRYFTTILKINEKYLEHK